MVEPKLRTKEITKRLRWKKLGLSKFTPPQNKIEETYYAALIRTWAAVDIFASNLEIDYKSRLHRYVAHELKELMAELKASVLQTGEKE